MKSIFHLEFLRIHHTATQCGLLKTNPSDAKCSICGYPLMRLIEKSVTEGKIDSDLKL